MLISGNESRRGEAMICANCQRPLPMPVATCPHCNKSPRRAVGASPMQQPKLTAAPTMVDHRYQQGKCVMHCVECGQQLPDDANFCMKCGVPQGSNNAANSGPTPSHSIPVRDGSQEVLIANGTLVYREIATERVYRQVYLRDLTTFEQHDGLFAKKIMLRTVDPFTQPPYSGIQIYCSTKEEVYAVAKALNQAIAS